MAEENFEYNNSEEQFRNHLLASLSSLSNERLSLVEEISQVEPQYPKKEIPDDVLKSIKTLFSFPLPEDVSHEVYAGVLYEYLGDIAEAKNVQQFKRENILPIVNFLCGTKLSKEDVEKVVQDRRNSSDQV